MLNPYEIFLQCFECQLALVKKAVGQKGKPKQQKERELKNHFGVQKHRCRVTHRLLGS